MPNITNFYDYLTILVCYSAGTGGNHISNLISTSNNVAPRFISDNYIPDLTNKYLNADFDVNFIDNEALFLHGAHYLKWVSKLLNFPIDCDNPDIFKFIEEDPNAKYVKYVDEYWLDQEVWNGIQPKATRGIA